MPQTGTTNDDMRDRSETLDSTLQSHFKILYERQRLRGKSQSTRDQFRFNIARFGRYLGRPATLDDLRDDVLADVMGWMLDEGKAPRTCNKFRDNMLALWRFFARKQLLDRWPDVDPFTEPHRIPVAWSREQLAMLWAACQSQTAMIGEVPGNLWWHALHAVAWDTGERITAVVNVPWVQVDLSGGWVVIRAESRKGKREDKLSRLHADTVLALQRIHCDRKRVFPWPFAKTYLWARYKKLLKRAGLPNDREHMFHCLRKSVASYFECCGGNATKLLGHSARKVTERYIDPRIVTDTHAADVLFRPGAK